MRRLQLHSRSAKPRDVIVLPYMQVRTRFEVNNTFAAVWTQGPVSAMSCLCAVSIWLVASLRILHYELEKEQLCEYGEAPH